MFKGYDECNEELTLNLGEMLVEHRDQVLVISFFGVLVEDDEEDNY